MIRTLPERPYKQHLRTALTLLLDLIVTAAILLSIYYFNYLVPHRLDTSQRFQMEAERFPLPDRPARICPSKVQRWAAKKAAREKTIPVLTLPANLLPSFQIRSFQPQILIGARIFLFRSHPTRWAPARRRLPTI